ncbi:hypothetical protein SEVIR_2G365133v4 [Setaria viridis]
MWICIEELVGLTKNVQEKDRLVLDGLRAWRRFSQSLLGNVCGILFRMILSMDGATITSLGIVLRVTNIRVVDSEFIVHRGVQTLGGSTTTKDGARGKKAKQLHQKDAEVKKTRGRAAGLDMRTKIRRKSRSELRDFQKRWDRATREDRTWVDPFARSRRKRRNRNPQ